MEFPPLLPPPTLEGAFSQASHQLHLLHSPVCTRDLSITKTAKCIQQTAQGLSNKLHCHFLPDGGLGRGRGSGGRGRGPYLRTTKETTRHGGGLPPSDSSTMTAQASNVSCTGFSDNIPTSDPNNNNNNNNHNNNNTGDDDTGDDDNNGPPKRQRTNSGENAENNKVQSFTLHIPRNSNFKEGTQQIIYNISEGVRKKR